MTFVDLQSRNDLADFLRIPRARLAYILYILNTENLYQGFDIAKKSGGVRHIDAPQEPLKSVQRSLAKALYEYRKTVLGKDKLYVSQAYEKGHSIITNASIHKNKRFVLNLDISDFFGSFHFGRVLGFFEKNKYFRLPHEVAIVIAQLSCFQGHLPQGSPCSPVITNLISQIMDFRLLKITKHYKVDYTRYADDLTFSTNDKHFLANKVAFLKDISREVQRSGFLLNESKYRLSYRDSRQRVTGLVVNQGVGVKKEFRKDTRAMANNLYTKGFYMMNGATGTLNQLEGRFAFIDQLDRIHHQQAVKLGNKIPSFNTREKQYQKFLVYKYFYANPKPLIATEGKTDIIYIEAALKNLYREYPELISKDEQGFHLKISFLKRNAHMEYFLKIKKDGADPLKNIYEFYKKDINSLLPDYMNSFVKKSGKEPSTPVMLLFDNESHSDKPLHNFLSAEKINLQSQLKSHVFLRHNLFLLAIPLQNGRHESEIEDLFDQKLLNYKINGKSFKRKDNDSTKYYGKAVFANYVLHHYQQINFSKFRPLLDDIKSVVVSDLAKLS